MFRMDGSQDRRAPGIPGGAKGYPGTDFRKQRCSTRSDIERGDDQGFDDALLNVLPEACPGNLIVDDLFNFRHIQKRPTNRIIVRLEKRKKTLQTHIQMHIDLQRIPEFQKCMNIQSGQMGIFKQLIEQYQNLLDRLVDKTLQRVAVYKLEGFTNGEIADKLDCSRRTVIRKLETIRLIWSEETKP